MLHTIGDSHCWIPYKKIPDVKTHWLGPVLAFSVGRDGLHRCNISGTGMKPNDWIIFSFGEIDCRGHIHKHITAENTYQRQIDEIVEKYFNTINLNKDLFKFDINIAVNNVVPPYPYDRTQNQDCFNHQFPFIGTDDQRKLYVNYFNQKLKENCLKNNYLFVDVYFEYSDQFGFLDIPLSDTNCHIGDPIYLTQFLKKHNIL
jgi:hypothetical protein